MESKFYLLCVGTEEFVSDENSKYSPDGEWGIVEKYDVYRRFGQT